MRRRRRNPSLTDLTDDLAGWLTRAMWTYGTLMALGFVFLLLLVSGAFSPTHAAGWGR